MRGIIILINILLLVIFINSGVPPPKPSEDDNSGVPPPKPSEDDNSGVPPPKPSEDDNSEGVLILSQNIFWS